MLAAMSSYSSPGGSGKTGIAAYCGACVRRAESEVWAVAGGGHLDYAGNEALVLNLQADSPAWSLRLAPTTSGNLTFGGSHNADGRPASRHTYWDCQFDDYSDKVFLLGAAATYGNGGDIYSTVDAFDRETNTYHAANFHPGIGAAQGGSVKSVAKDMNTGDVYILNEVSFALYKWDRALKTTTEITWPTVGIDYNTACVHDPVRNRLIFFAVIPFYLDVGAAFARTTITFTGAGAAGGDWPCYAHYDELRDSVLVMRRDSNTVYELNLTTFAITVLSISGTAPPAPQGNDSGLDYLFGRWFRCPELGISGVVRHPSSNVAVFRTGAPPTLESDWTSRSAGALLAERFNTSGAINAFTQPGDVVWEQTIKRSGAGAWRVNVPASRSTDVGSQRLILPSVRGNGTTTYYQFTYYCPESFSRYKPSHGGDIGGVKMFILSAPGDASNTPCEIVLVNPEHKGFVDLYWQDGNVTAVHDDAPLSTPGNSTNFKLNNAVNNGVPQTLSNDDDAETRYGIIYTNSLRATTPNDGDVFSQGHPSPRAIKAGSMRIPSDGWITILLQVTIGTLGTASSTIKLWACIPGFPYHLLSVNNNVTLGNFGGGHQNIWLTPYDSNRVGNSPGVIDTYMICTEVIASASFIPAPKVR
jgi:hypothetical protein